MRFEFEVSDNICYLAVLQRYEEEYKEQSFAVLLLRLDDHSEPFCNEPCLAEALSFSHSLHLSFPHHVGCSISLECSRLLSRTRKKPKPGLTSRLMRAMVLLNGCVAKNSGGV
jgi:hypothetical protein